MSVNLYEEGYIEITDLGVTLRTLLAVAAQGYQTQQRRKWSIKYKGAVIGWLQVKDDHLKLVKGKRHDVNRSNSAPKAGDESPQPGLGLVPESLDICPARVPSVADSGLGVV